MNLIPGEPEEPPSCHTATTTLLTKPHRRINSSLPVTVDAFGALSARLERFPQALLPSGGARRVERLALAGTPAHPHARRGGAAVRAVRRRARCGRPASRIAAARHHTLLREPDESRGLLRAAASHTYPGRHRISEDAGRGRRPAWRRRPYRGARPRASLSGPGAVPGHRLLLDLLPLLNALPHGRRAWRRLFLQPPAMGGGALLHRGAPRDSRRP